MKREKKIQHNLLIALLLILVFSTISFSQTSESNEESVVIPEQVMKQIVRRVLIHYFKPRSQKKVVYLSEEDIQQSWLPKINGIDFQLLNTQHHRGTDHYLFRFDDFFDKNSFGFAYGASTSGFYGDIWQFRITQQAVKIWRNNNKGFGSSGDDHGSRDIPPPPIIEPPPPITQKRKNQ